MTKVYLLKIEEMGNYTGARTRYTFHKVNNKGEKLIVELGHCDADSSIVKIWKSKKWIAEGLTSWITVEVYVIDKDGNCWSKYNPQSTKEHKINFKWVLEDTKPNRNRILTEITKLAFEEA